MQRLIVRRASDGEVLWTVDVAGSWLARLRGLIGRSSLEPNAGLFFPGTNGVHMLFMRFGIDCVFVGAPRPDGSRQVVAVRSHLRPWMSIVWWVRGAHGAIELLAGSAAAAGVSTGDLLRLEPAA